MTKSSRSTRGVSRSTARRWMRLASIKASSATKSGATSVVTLIYDLDYVIFD